MTPLPLAVYDASNLPSIDSTLDYLKTVTQEEALQAVQQLSQQESEDWFRIGMVLSAYRLNRTDTEWNDLLAYADENFQVNKRKAYYLIGIYENLSKSQITLEQVKSVGWTKLKEIAHLLTQDNVEYWVKVANENSTKSLLNLLKSKATADSDVAALLDEHLDTPAAPVAELLAAEPTLDEHVVMGVDYSPEESVSVLTTYNSKGEVEDVMKFPDPVKAEPVVTVISEVAQEAGSVSDAMAYDHPKYEVSFEAPTATLDITPEPEQIDHTALVAKAAGALKQYSAATVINTVSLLFPNFKIISATAEKDTTCHP